MGEREQEAQPKTESEPTPDQAEAKPGDEEPRPVEEEPEAAAEPEAPAEDEAEEAEAAEDAEVGGPDLEVVPEPEPLDPMDELKRQLEEAQSRLRVVSKGYTELQDEMKAFRARTEQRGQVQAERQVFQIVRVFFDPVQNLKRSLELAGDDAESLREGLRMVLGQFEDGLNKLGLEEVPGVGARFDPNVHEALALSPVLDPEQDGTVLMVHSAGYTVGGKVLQAAQVVVGKHEEAAGEA